MLITPESALSELTTITFEESPASELITICEPSPPSVLITFEESAESELMTT